MTLTAHQGLPTGSLDVATATVWPGVADPAALLTEIAGWLRGYGNRGTRRTYAEGLGLPTTGVDLRDWVDTPAATPEWAAALGRYAAALGLSADDLGTVGERPGEAVPPTEPPHGGRATRSPARPVAATERSHGGRAGSPPPSRGRPAAGTQAGERRTPPPAARGRLRHVHWFRWCVAAGLDPLAAAAADVKAWLDALNDAGAAPATRDRMLGTLKSLYGCLAEVGLTAGNPAALNRRRLGLATTGRTSSTVTLTTAQVRQLYELAGRVRPGVSPLGAARAKAVVALFTLGLRVSELCGLDRADLHVTRGRRALRVLGKGDKPRIVYLSTPAEEALAAYLRTRDARGSGTREVARGRTATDSPLIATTGGARCTRQGIWHLLRRVAGAADGPLRDVAGDLHPHALRHFYVTTAVEAGAQLVHVQADVGHTSIDTTEQVYNSAARDPSRSAVDLVADAVLNG